MTTRNVVETILVRIEKIRLDRELNDAGLFLSSIKAMHFTGTRIVTEFHMESSSNENQLPNFENVRKFFEFGVGQAVADYFNRIDGDTIEFRPRWHPKMDARGDITAAVRDLSDLFHTCCAWATAESDRRDPQIGFAVVISALMDLFVRFSRLPHAANCPCDLCNREDRPARIDRSFLENRIMGWCLADEEEVLRSCEIARNYLECEETQTLVEIQARVYGFNHAPWRS